jgi:hypothetical protein
MHLSWVQNISLLDKLEDLSKIFSAYMVVYSNVALCVRRYWAVRSKKSRDFFFLPERLSVSEGPLSKSPVSLLFRVQYINA